MNETQLRVSPWWLVPPGLLFVLNFIGSLFIRVPDQSNAVYKPSLIAQTAVFDLLLVAYVAFAAWRSTRRVGQTLALRRVAFAPAARMAAGVFVAVTAFSLLTDPLTNAGKKQGIAPTHGPQDSHQWLALGFSLVALVVIAPVAEELMFRGLCFAGMGRYALPGSAALFAVAHGLPVLLLPIFVIGLGLGWLRSRTGSVYPGMGVHMSVNALALLVALATGAARLC